jgi:t-SNARE complex subunit (syntaxin)
MESKLILQNPEHSVDASILLERETEIKTIQKDLATVQELFSQLSTLIETQGPDIIKVSQHIETSEKKVDDGVRQLQEAHNRTWRCIIL